MKVTLMSVPVHGGWGGRYSVQYEYICENVLGWPGQFSVCDENAFIDQCFILHPHLYFVCRGCMMVSVGVNVLRWLIFIPLHYFIYFRLLDEGIELLCMCSG